MNAQQIRVLVVEDDPVYAGLLQDVLRPVSPFQLTAVGRFDEALRQLGAASFDVVLLDLCLPDRMGLATYRDLRDPWPALGCPRRRGRSASRLCRGMRVWRSVMMATYARPSDGRSTG